MVSGNRVTLLHDGEQAFPAMLAAIAEARREILLEMYWFASDEVGRKFAAALIARAAAGVRVRVIYDAVGSLQSENRILCPIPWAFDYGYGQLLVCLRPLGESYLPDILVHSFCNHLVEMTWPCSSNHS